MSESWAKQIAAFGLAAIAMAGVAIIEGRAEAKRVLASFQAERVAREGKRDRIWHRPTHYANGGASVVTRAGIEDQ